MINACLLGPFLTPFFLQDSIYPWARSNAITTIRIDPYDGSHHHPYSYSYC